RARTVTGVQTCALPISPLGSPSPRDPREHPFWGRPQHRLRRGDDGLRLLRAARAALRCRAYGAGARARGDWSDCGGDTGPGSPSPLQAWSTTACRAPRHGTAAGVARPGADPSRRSGLAARRDLARAFRRRPILGRILLRSYVQAAVPPQLLGRVNATIRVVAWGGVPVGAVLGGT